MASTLEELYDAYEENVSWLREQSVAKALAFAETCRLLLIHLPQTSVKGGDTLQFQAELRKSIQDAEQFVAGQDGATYGGASVKHPDFSTLRD